MQPRNHCSSQKGIPKMKLQASRPISPKNLQSQTSSQTKNRLAISRLGILHGRLNSLTRSSYFHLSGLSIASPHDEASIVEFFNRPRWREAARGGHGRRTQLGAGLAADLDTTWIRVRCRR